MARTYQYREPKRKNAPSPNAADNHGVCCKEALRPANHGGRKNTHGTPTMVRLRHYLGKGQGSLILAFAAAVLINTCLFTNLTKNFAC